MSRDFAGCLGFLLLFVAYMAVSHGLPASAVCLAFLILFAAFQRLRTQLDERLAASLSKEFFAGALGTMRKASLWAAVGTGIVWAIQLILQVLPDPDPGKIGAAQLLLADWANAVRDATTIWNVLAATIVVLLLAMAVGALWPIGAASIVKRWAGISVAVISAMSAFTFVSASVAGQNYDQVEGLLRAQLHNNLAELVQARKDAAALHFLNSAVQRQLHSPGRQDRAWRNYFEVALSSCIDTERAFEAGYSSQQFNYYHPEGPPKLCDEDQLRPRLSRARIADHHKASPPVSDLAWVPDLAPLVSVHPAGPGADEGIDTLEASARVRKIDELRTLGVRVRRKLEDASAARDALRGSVAGSANKLLEGLLPGEIGSIVGDWTGAFLDVVARKGSNELGRLIVPTGLAGNRAIAQLIDVDESDVGLIPPEGDGLAAGLRVSNDYLQSHKVDPRMSLDQIKDYGVRFARAESEEHTRTLESQAGSLGPRPYDLPPEPHPEPLRPHPIAL